MVTKSKNNLNSILEEVIAEYKGAIDCVKNIIPSGFPPYIADSIFKGIEENIKRII